MLLGMSNGIRCHPRGKWQVESKMNQGQVIIINCP